MQEEILTLESLSSDFEFSIDEMRNLAKECGISCPISKPLNQNEIDALYDAYITGEKKITANKRNVREKKILIDASSLLESGAEMALKRLVPKVLREGRQLIIPFIVMEELNKKALKGNNTEQKRASRIMKIILDYKDLGAIAIYGDSNDMQIGFADGVFQKILTMFGLDYDITVITQDYELTRDLLNMGNMKSVRHRKINVFKITNDGKLVKAINH